MLYCEDFRITTKRIPDKSVNMILTDPPYGIGYLSHRTDNHDEIENDKLNDWSAMLPDFFIEAKRILTDTGCCCCGGGGGKTPVTAMFIMEAIKHFELIQTLVWRKFIGLGWKYRPAYENIVVLSKSKDNYDFYDESKKCSNVIQLNQQIQQIGEHPTVKPVRLMEHLLRIHSKPGDLIYDPFMGSGTTAIAAINLEREWIGSEIKKEYYELALKRIKTESIQKGLQL